MLYVWFDSTKQWRLTAADGLTTDDVDVTDVSVNYCSAVNVVKIEERIVHVSVFGF